MAEGKSANPPYTGLHGNPQKIAGAKAAAGLPDDIPDDSLLVIVHEIVSPGDRWAGVAA